MADLIPILLYHGVDARAAERFTLTITDFTAQMDAVAACGRRAQTVSELAAPRARDEPMSPSAVAITFDDGTADFLDRAWPVLHERGLPVTLYVASGLVGGRHEGRPMLSWRGLEELRDAGVEIGAHSHQHVALDILPRALAVREFVNSKLALEDRLQIEISTFAYPFGYHSAALERLAERAGYTSACAVKNALSHPYDDRFALARFMLERDTGGERVTELLAGHGAPVAPRREGARTRAWRLYRRAVSRTRSTRFAAARSRASAAVSGSRSNL